MSKLILFSIISFFTSLSQIYAQNPPISPKWVFEPWVWEDEGNKNTVWELLNGYQDNNIPVGAVIIDSPWEEPENNGYNTFTFSSSRYDNPKVFIDSLKRRDIHVILWTTGVMIPECPLYQEALDSNYFIDNGATTYFWHGEKQLASRIDFFNPAAVQFWDSLMGRVLDMGVDGWKVDESDYFIPNQVHTKDSIKTKREYSDAYYSKIYNYTQLKRGNYG